MTKAPDPKTVPRDEMVKYVKKIKHYKWHSPDRYAMPSTLVVFKFKGKGSIYYGKAGRKCIKTMKMAQFVLTVDYTQLDCWAYADEYTES